MVMHPEMKMDDVVNAAIHKAKGIANQMERDIILHKKLMNELTVAGAKVRAQLVEATEELEKILKRIGDLR